MYSGIIEKYWTYLTKGINMCVFTYGQTFSGKTHTMKGVDRDPGLVHRTLEGIFSKLGSLQKCCFEINMSYYEIYNEAIYDLLDPNNGNPLEVRQVKDKGAQIQDLTRPQIDSLAGAKQLFERGEIKRRFAITNMNHNSSRSHVIVQLDIKTRFLAAPMKTYCSTLMMADLAGSECIEKSKTTGQSQREGSLINKSLLALSNIILKLSNQDGFVSYRESKLTRILQPVLTENCVTAIICTVNPEKSHLQESLNTLRFGICAGGIRTVLKPNVQDKMLGSAKKKQTQEEHLELIDRIESLSSELLDTKEKLEDALLQLKHERGDHALKDQTLRYLEAEVKSEREQKEKLRGELEKTEKLLSDQEEAINRDLKGKFDRILHDMKQSYELQISRLKHQIIEMTEEPQNKSNIDFAMKLKVKEVQSRCSELEKEIRSKNATIYTLQEDGKHLRKELAQLSDLSLVGARKKPNPQNTPKSAQKAHHSLNKLAHSAVEEGFSATKLTSLLDGRKAFFLPHFVHAAETKESFFTPSKSEFSKER